MNDMRKAFEIPAPATAKGAAPAGSTFVSPFAFSASQPEAPRQEGQAAASSAPAYFARPAPTSEEPRPAAADVGPNKDQAASPPGPGSAATVPHGDPLSSPSTPATPLVDPMQWWGAVARQFTDIARQAVANTAAATTAANAATSAVGSVAAAAVADVAKKVQARAQTKAAKKAAPASAAADASRASNPTAKPASARRAEPAAKAAGRRKA
jgi:hypothetical protein